MEATGAPARPRRARLRRRRAGLHRSAPKGHLADGFGYADGPTGSGYGGPADHDSTLPLTHRTCVRVIDGDTVELDGGERVRYIGINTPETKHPRKPVEWMGKEASEANRILAEGKRVGLEFDVGRTDKYNGCSYLSMSKIPMAREGAVAQGYAPCSRCGP